MDIMAERGTSSDRLRLDFVPAADLQMVWPKIRAGLETVQAKAPEHWIPEDIYHAVKSNAASLHIWSDPSDGEYLGFVVLTRIDYYDGPTLRIWVLYSEGEHDLLAVGMPEIIQMARNINARRITFSSPRKGWERAGAALGFRPTQQTFELEV